MNILITAGGTTEKIDDVRGITNHATGALGCEIAEKFLENGAQVTYLASKNAIAPKHSNCKKIIIGSTMDLQETLTKLLTETQFDAVIHSMAVSDYHVAATFSQQQMLSQLTTAIQEVLKEENLSEIDWQMVLGKTLAEMQGQTATKISSKYEALWLKLTQTPKVIETIKRLQPKTLLVGFKLLVNVSPHELRQVAHNLLEKNGCDFVLANDLSEVHSHAHHGYLIKANGSFKEAFTKKEIATLIYESLSKELK